MAARDVAVDLADRDVDSGRPAGIRAGDRDPPRRVDHCPEGVDIEDDRARRVPSQPRFARLGVQRAGHPVAVARRTSRGSSRRSSPGSRASSDEADADGAVAADNRGFRRHGRFLLARDRQRRPPRTSGSRRPILRSADRAGRSPSVKPSRIIDSVPMNGTPMSAETSAGVNGPRPPRRSAVRAATSRRSVDTSRPCSSGRRPPRPRRTSPRRSSPGAPGRSPNRGRRRGSHRRVPTAARAARRRRTSVAGARGAGRSPLRGRPG